MVYYFQVYHIVVRWLDMYKIYKMIASISLVPI